MIRHVDPNIVADIERKHELVTGTLEGFAFAKPLVEEVTAGRITRSDWVRQVGELEGSAEAAEEWVQPAYVDRDILDLSDEIRRLGLRTAVLTHGTDIIPAEIAALGLASRFDAIFNPTGTAGRG